MTTDKFRFRAKHFYGLLEEQEYKCYYTGRELRPENTQAVHIEPLEHGGPHELENIALVDRHVHFIKRYLSEDELLELATDIIKFKGRDYGFRLSKKSVPSTK